jgi:hypothetical protein
MVNVENITGCPLKNNFAKKRLKLTLNELQILMGHQ